MLNLISLNNSHKGAVVIMQPLLFALTNLITFII